MKKQKLPLNNLKVKSFITNFEEDKSQTVKGGSDTLYDIACQNSFGGPNTLCNSEITLCEDGNTRRCPSVQVCNFTDAVCP